MCVSNHNKLKISYDVFDQFSLSKLLHKAKKNKLIGTY